MTNDDTILPNSTVSITDLTTNPNLNTKTTTENTKNTYTNIVDTGYVSQVPAAYEDVGDCSGIRVGPGNYTASSRQTMGIRVDPLPRDTLNPARVGVHSGGRTGCLDPLKRMAKNLFEGKQLESAVSPNLIKIDEHQLPVLPSPDAINFEHVIARNKNLTEFLNSTKLTDTNPPRRTNYFQKNALLLSAIEETDSINSTEYFEDSVGSDASNYYRQQNCNMPDGNDVDDDDVGQCNNTIPIVTTQIAADIAGPSRLTTTVADGDLLRGCTDDMDAINRCYARQDAIDNQVLNDMVPPSYNY